MIGIMLTMAKTREELAVDYTAWLREFGKPPMAILGHTDLPFAFPEQSGPMTLFQGIRVLDLDDLILVHGDDLWDTDHANLEEG